MNLLHFREECPIEEMLSTLQLYLIYSGTYECNNGNINLLINLLGSYIE